MLYPCATMSMRQVAKLLFNLYVSYQPPLRRSHAGLMPGQVQVPLTTGNPICTGFMALPCTRPTPAFGTDSSTLQKWWRPRSHACITRHRTLHIFSRRQCFSTCRDDCPLDRQSRNPGCAVRPATGRCPLPRTWGFYLQSSPRHLRLRSQTQAGGSPRCSIHIHTIATLRQDCRRRMNLHLQPGPTPASTPA